MGQFLLAVERGCASLGRAAAWTVPLLVISVCVGIVLVQLRANVLFEWGSPALPLFGTGLTAGGLNDLQWHLFAVMVMLGGAYTLHENGHVCVDFISSRFSPRGRLVMTLLGDLFLLLPFVAVMTWFSWEYVQAAYASGEGSSYGGLNQRWIIKLVMPLGFGLLLVFGVARALRTALALLGSKG